MKTKNLILIGLLLIGIILIAGCLEKEKQPSPQKTNISIPPSMTFGVAIDVFCDWLQGKENPINMDIAKKEVDAAKDIGVDFVRFDIRDELISSPEELKKLDEIIDYTRAKDLKIYLGVYGRFNNANLKLWKNPLKVMKDYPTGGSGLATWDEFKKMYTEEVRYLVERYHPDYMMIMVECPFLIGNQVNSVRTIDEWINYTNHVASVIKNTSSNTKIITDQMVRTGEVHYNIPFTEALMKNNSGLIDIIGIDPYSFDELDNEVSNIVRLRDKHDWNGEIWIGETNIMYPRSEAEQKKYFERAINLAIENDFEGFCIFYLREPDPYVGSVGILNEDFTPKPAYNFIKEIIENRQNP